MSEIICSTCGAGFEGTRHACCPACLARRWSATPNLVRPKHDPGAPAESLLTYRSIITPRAKSELPLLLADAAVRGRWFWDRDYRMWVHVTERPLGRFPGVGILAGREEAEHALDCLFIAEADSDREAHVFAADGERHEAQIRAGVFEPLGVCESRDCANLRRPDLRHCELHR